MFTVKCDVALPCATQNELRLEDAKALIENGCIAVARGREHAHHAGGDDYLREHGVLFAPRARRPTRAAWLTSALEMSQNSMRLSWSFDEVDAKLKDIMVNIFNNIDSAAKEYGMPGQLRRRREYRGLPQGGQRDGSAGRGLIFVKLHKKSQPFAFTQKAVFGA